MMRIRHLKHALGALLLAGSANAQTGVSDDRVSLPEGPGSQQGIGDNTSVNPNMGSMAYSVPIDVPAGFEGVTPGLTLGYSSSAANGILGYGWSMPQPFVERMTNWGLPSYDRDDLFVADGGSQLVRVDNGDVPTYRSRFEGSFMRYRWHDAEDGTAGYWTGETPHGITWYFGADHTGATDEAAQFRGQHGTFRYHLKAAVDQFGHRAEYTYRSVDGVPYLDAIRYTFASGDAASTVRFIYEAREDIVSDARSGSNERMSQRLSAVEVYAGETRLWRYDLSYEDYATSNGQTRLVDISRVGLDNTPDPATFSFEYSKTLGGACEADCESPFLVDMGDLGVSLGAGNATLIDINGDALPDVVDTSLAGQHRFFINRLDPAGEHAFDAPYRSQTGDQSGHRLSSAYVQVLDVNGDGRTDMLNALTGELLLNMGAGDWEAAPDVGNNTLPDFGEDFAVGAEELSSVRFLDYDMDKRIDVLLSRDQTTQVWRNGSAGFVLDETVESIGAGFSDTRLEMADMNGDGLMDPVILAAGILRWRINLGWGQWSAWREINDLPFNEAELEFVELEDINGDGMDDIVLVLADELRYALNRGGDRFDPTQTVNSAGGRALPIRVADTTVLYADMNGSGSDDVVWITSGGEVTYLELFPLRPNLLTKISTGLGVVTDVTYVTSAAHRAVADEDWAYTVPFPMIMVASTDTYDLFNNVHSLTEYTYSDAYYDTEEKVFRGFERVSIRIAGDAHQAAGVQERHYDVGIEDRYYNGLQISNAIFEEAQDGALIPLVTNISSYGECDLTDVPDDLSYPVRFICSQRQTTTIAEGAAPGDWVTQSSESIHDGYGNVVESINHGVTAIGGGGCPPCVDDDSYGAPCGEECLGDELLVSAEYAVPTDNADRWLLHKVTRVRSTASVDASLVSETLTYYDGPSFVGLAAGLLTHGRPTRVVALGPDGQSIDRLRVAYDDHGNIIEALDPRGTPGELGFRRRTTYDADGLLVTSEAIELTDADGGPYELKRDYTIEPNWGVLASSTDWSMIRDGAIVVEGETTRWEYDALGRRVADYLPGDVDGRPTNEYLHEPGLPISQVRVRQRSVIGARLPDIESTRCMDGFGRTYQIRRRLEDGRFEVDEFTTRNRNGLTVSAQPSYVDDEAGCALQAPDAPGFEHTFDALGRHVETLYPDASIFGTASRSRTTRAPLQTQHFDTLDTTAEAPFADTPLIRHYDGLGRIVAVEQVTDAGSETYRLTYDALGNLRSIIDPAGHARVQTWDAFGRLVEVVDPDRGTIVYEHDPAGNVIARTDGEARVTHWEYDTLNRGTAQYDPADAEATMSRMFYDDPAHCAGECGYTASALVRSEFPGGTDEIQRDARGRIVGRVRELGGVGFALGYGFDNLNRLTRQTTPDGSEFSFQYDAVGRVVAIPGVIDRVEFSRANQVDAIHYANGTQELWQYDQMIRPTSMRVLDGDGQTLSHTTRSYHRTGLLKTRGDEAPVDGQPGLGAEYQFDALYRLTGVTMDPGRAALEERLTFEYDATRLLSRVSSFGPASDSHVGALTYAQERPNAVVGAGETTLAYDGAGGLTRRGEMTFERNFRGNVVAAHSNGATVMSIAYDGSDNRTHTQRGGHFRYFVDPTFEIEDGMALTHVYLGGAPVATVESDVLAAEVLSDLAPDGRIDTADAVLAVRADALEIAGEISSVRSLLAASVRSRLLQGGTRTEYRHATVHKLVVLTTDSDGQALDRPRVDPFGVERKVELSRRVFNGRERDEATGLLNFGSRLYDPKLGRFISPDKLSEQVRYGLAAAMPWEAAGHYQYARNNPVAFDDQGGFAPEPQQVKSTRPPKVPAASTLFGEPSDTVQPLSEMADNGFFQDVVALAVSHTAKHGGTKAAYVKAVTARVVYNSLQKTLQQTGLAGGPTAPINLIEPDQRELVLKEQAEAASAELTKELKGLKIKSAARRAKRKRSFKPIRNRLRLLAGAKKQANTSKVGTAVRGKRKAGRAARAAAKASKAQPSATKPRPRSRSSSTRL